MRRLDRKQKDLLGEVLSRIIIYLATIALIKQILQKQFDPIASVIVAIALVILTIIAIIVVKEEKSNG